jgi:hypothetical protein
MLLCVTGPIVPEVSKYCIAFIFRVKLSKKTGLFYPEAESTTYLRSAGNNSPDGTALHAGRLGSSSTNNIYNTENRSPCRLLVTVPAGIEDMPQGTEQDGYLICYWTRSTRTREDY